MEKNKQKKKLETLVGGDVKTIDAVHALGLLVLAVQTSKCKARSRISKSITSSISCVVTCYLLRPFSFFTFYVVKNRKPPVQPQPLTLLFLFTFTFTRKGKTVAVAVRAVYGSTIKYASGFTGITVM